MHHHILHKQTNALLGKFFLPCYYYNQGEGENLRKKFLQTACPTRGKQTPVSLVSLGGLT